MDSAAVRRLGAQFEGMLVQQMLQPLTESLGEVGDFALAPMAQEIAAHDTSGFGALLATALGSSDVRG